MLLITIAGVIVSGVALFARFINGSANSTRPALRPLRVPQSQPMRPSSSNRRIRGG